MSPGSRGQTGLTGRGARLDISQRELASFLIGEHILAASAGTLASPSDAAEPPPTALVASKDKRWLLCHGPSRDALVAALRELAPNDRSALDASALTAALARLDVQAIAVRNAGDLLDAVKGGESKLAFARAPEVIIAPSSHGSEWVKESDLRRDFAATPAIRSNRIVWVNPDLVDRPGPRIVEGLERLAEGIHPGQDRQR